MIVDLSPAGTSQCSVCREWISAGSVHIWKKRSNGSTQDFHLRCFRPRVLAPISRHFFRGPDCMEIRTWVSHWNQQFALLSEAAVPAQYLSKAVSTSPTAFRRTLLESFAYLTVQEVETSAAVVCKAWFHVSRDSELWKGRFVAEFRPSTTDSEADYRRKFIAYSASACMGCRQLIQPGEVARRCVYYNRLLCKQCNQLPKWRMISLNYFMEQKLVQPTTLKFLKVPEFTFNKVNCCYAEELTALIIPYAERRLKVLLEVLRTSKRAKAAELKEAERLDLQAFYREEKNKFSRFTAVEKQVFKFCGKCQKGERIQKNIDTFFEKLRKK